MGKTIIRFMCAISSEPFDVVLVPSYNDNYRIGEIKTASSIGVDEAVVAREGDNTQVNIPSEKINWDGIECPWCKANYTEGISFVRCGSCKSFICSGNVEAAPSGEISFTCHDGCGRKGVIGGGTIGSYSAEREADQVKIGHSPKGMFPNANQSGPRRSR